MQNYKDLRSAPRVGPFGGLLGCPAARLSAAPLSMGRKGANAGSMVLQDDLSGSLL